MPTFRTLAREKRVKKYKFITWRFCYIFSRLVLCPFYNSSKKIIIISNTDQMDAPPPIQKIRFYLKEEWHIIRSNWAVINTVGFIITAVVLIVLGTWKAPFATLSVWGGLIILIFFYLIIGTFLRYRKAKKNFEKYENIKTLHWESVDSLSGKKISLSEAEEKQFFSSIPTIAFLGVKSVGKTTLIENLCQKDNTFFSTKSKDAYILKLSEKDKYVIVLDTAGERQAAQHDIALKANILIVLLDNSASDTSQFINYGRQDQHSSFLELLKERLEESNHKPIKIHFIFNKADLWEKLNNVKKNEQMKFFLSKYSFFENSFKDSFVTYTVHSNNASNNITRIKNLIEQIN